MLANRNLLRPICFLFLTAFLIPANGGAQEARSGVPNIFLDCQWGCDMQFLRTEMHYVNFMRDRADADIFVQQTSLATGSGGDQVTLIFSGKKDFEGMEDTIVYNLEPNIPWNTVRETMKANLDRGILPFLLKTPIAEKIEFSIPKDPDANGNQAIQEAKDPWNLWVHSVNGWFNINGQELSNQIRFGGGYSARRISDTQKTNLNINGSFNRNVFHFEDSPTEIYDNGSYWLGGSQIFSIDGHWGIGAWGNMRQSQFTNIQLSTYIGPALEYSVFPYSEAAIRQFTFQYRVGYRYNRYFEETIYFKTEENLGQHSFDIDYNQIAQWGDFNAGVSTGNYFHDWGLHYINFYSGISVNLFKGFRLGIWGRYRVVNNQIELPNGGASKDEALLRIRQLRTGFNYRLNFNVSYTFGSIYSNVVNPAFDN